MKNGTRCIRLASGQNPLCGDLRPRHTLVAVTLAGGFTTVFGCSPDDIRSSMPPIPTSPARRRLDTRLEDRALRRAVDWLWNAQSADGGWRSETYGLLESGQALTPFVLYALLKVPEDVCPRPKGGVDRGLAWIRESMIQRGEVGMADPEAPEYPNYSTAYSLLCLSHAGSEEDKPLIEATRDYLVDLQFRENNGFGPETVVYGGWGFGGPLPVGGSRGHMDVHHTRVVLQSLRAAGVTNSDVLCRAEAFLRVVQKHPDVRSMRPAQLATAPFSAWDAPWDGGFYFSPVALAANKGGLVREGEKRYYRSYASATCDGMLALLACQIPRDDERFVHARKWLEEHSRLDWPDGVPQETNENWGESIRFTHFAAQAEVQAALDWDTEDRRKLAQLVAAQQRSDGSFMNGIGFLMKEDDRMLCTALAMTALTKANEYQWRP